MACHFYSLQFQLNDRDLIDSVLPSTPEREGKKVETRKSNLSWKIERVVDIKKYNRGGTERVNSRGREMI